MRPAAYRPSLPPRQATLSRSRATRKIAGMQLPLGDLVETLRCPHVAILLRGPAEIYRVQASFYAVGLHRNGFVVHRSLPGRRADRDRTGLARAGLDVAALEEAGRLVVDETPVTEPADQWAQRWTGTVDEALARGFQAVWWTGYPIGPDDQYYRLALEYDRAWEASVARRRSVSLCLYIVEGLDEEERRARVDELASFHDAVLISGADGVSVEPGRSPVGR
jgi:MEDS: MEthanogen/methylotroph, DcmR Sensory domain